MTITGTSISGGFEDPESMDPLGTVLNAVNEYSNFTDQITVDLVSMTDPFVTYSTLNNLTTTVLVNGTPITFNELTNNGNVQLNVLYSSPNTNSVSGLTVITNIHSGNTAGNIYITGNIQNAFPDKYWEYRNFSNNLSAVVTSTNDIPDADIALHLHKPSFMRYVNIEFNVVAEYDLGTESRSIFKKVVNDWEINRLALISQISREENYRSNNYPQI